MILIISYNQEITTTEVMRWLKQMNKKFIRVYEHEEFDIKIIDKKILLKSERNQFYLDDITSVWYRRGELKLKKLRYKNPSINQFMHETQYWLEDFIHQSLASKRHINQQNNSAVNKLWVLQKAVEKGLQIPNYFLAENMKDVVINKTITKTITQGVYIENIFEKTNAFSYTAVINEQVKEPFFISFFQEKIEKEFEIRCFYLDGKVWSFAIFSQNDEQTKVDFRRYNDKKPNRNVPYNIPKELETKIDSLMKFLNLNSGSLDFMKNGDNFYFLEVNPIGQFLGLSYKCNYNIEKEIANYL